MYRTQALGLIFDEEARSYRPLYRALALDSAISPEKLQNKISNINNLMSPSKPAYFHTQTHQKLLLSPVSYKSSGAFLEIDARVKSPRSQSQFSIIPKHRPNSESVYIYDSNHHLNSLQRNQVFSNKTNPIVPEQIQQIRQVRKKITEYSRISKTYQEPETQILDYNSTQIHTLNLAVHQLIDLLKQKSTKQSTNNNQNLNYQYLNKINREIIDLSLTIDKKNVQIQNLQQQLQKQRVYLTNANHNVKAHQQKLRLEEEYGNQSRKKLREEIDQLKNSYYELVRRVECETASESPSEKNQYKSLYEQTQKQLEQIKKKTYKESVDTEVFTLHKNKDND